MQILILHLGAVLISLAGADPRSSVTEQGQTVDTPQTSQEEALQRADTINQKASQLYRQGDAESALPLLAEALRLYTDELGERHPKSLNSLVNYGYMLTITGHSDEGTRQLAKALELSREVLGELHTSTLDILAQYGLTLRVLGRITEAEPLLAEAMAKRTQALGEQHPDTLSSMSNYAMVLDELGRVKEAEPIYSEALRLKRQVLGERHPATLQSLANYGQSLVKLGLFEPAEPLLRDAMVLYQEVMGKHHRFTLISTGLYANVLQELGRVDEAEALLAEATRVSRQVLGERDKDTLTFLSNHAVSLMALGRYQEAEPLLSEVLQARRKLLGESHPETVQSLSIYASLLTDQGRVQEAEPLYAEAFRRQRVALGLSHPQTLVTLNALGMAHARLGNLERARQLLGEAFLLRKEAFTQSHPDTLVSLNNYAGVLKAMGRFREAEPMLAEVLRIRKDRLGKRHPDTLVSLNNYAEILRDLGRNSEAEPLLVDALRLRKELLGNQHPDTLGSIINYVSLLYLQGRFAEALPLVRLLASAKRARSANLSQQNLREDVQSSRERAESQWIEKLVAEILWSNKKDSAPGKLSLAEEAFLALQLASTGSNSRAVKEAAALRFASREGVRELVEHRQALGREWVQTENELVESLAGGQANATVRENLQDRLKQIEGDVAEIDDKLSTDAPEYFAIINQQAVSLEGLRSVLDDDEAVLILVPTELGTQMMGVNRATIEWARGDLGSEDLGAKISELRDSLEVTSSGQLPVFNFELAHEIYTELIKPIKGALDGKSRIYVVADGALSRLPLGVLLTRKLNRASIQAYSTTDNDIAEPARATSLGQTTEVLVRANDPDDFQRASWLADRYALVSLPSLQSLVYIRTLGLDAQNPEETVFTGFGDPVLSAHNSQVASRSAGMDAVDAATMLAPSGAGKSLMDATSLRQLSSLPGTKLELELVGQLLGASETDLYLGSAMTEPAIRGADLSKTRILHIATHGLTSEEGGVLGDLAEPGLVFTPPIESSQADDGYLAASEVVGLNLALAEWVILSACNTAAPSGTTGEIGLSGLAQAFFYAGAESLLVSHWPVFDSIAPLLTAETLSRAEKGISRAEALQKAMQEVRKTNPHPAAWAPFVLVGEGR